MRIKKFKARDMADALKTVKDQLGENALILSTRKLAHTTRNGESLEVVAAVDTGTSGTLQRPIGNRLADLGVRGRQRNYAARVYSGESSGQTEPAAAPVETASSPGPAPAKEEQSHRPGFRGQLKRCLLRSGVEGEIVETLLGQIEARYPQKTFQDAATARAALEEVITPYIRTVPDPPDDRQRIVAIVGPTGVGKTTSIAKIAAQNKIKKKQKVALISIDTFRIGAIDQLRTFAHLASIPLHVGYSPDQLHKIITSLSDCDAIYIDTTGRNPRNVEYIRELRSYLLQDRQIDIHLTLSATTRYPELADIVSNYGELQFNQVILTKIDEVFSQACMLNLHKLTERPLAYVGTGQNIPDDLLQADSKMLAQSMVEKWNLEAWIN